MKIKDLPAGTVTELCRYLNIEGDGQRNWKELVTRIPGRPRIPSQIPYRTTLSTHTQGEYTLCTTSVRLLELVGVLTQVLQRKSSPTSSL